MNESSKKILSRLENQCARREYCSSEILAKAVKALSGTGREGSCSAVIGHPSAGGGVQALSDSDKLLEAREILGRLIADGYVDDLRYASAFAREKASLTGWGVIKIRFALGAKKIDKDIIDRALEDIDTDKASDKLERLMAAKWKSLQGDPQARLKLLKFGLSRGYEYDAVQEAANKIISYEN